MSEPRLSQPNLSKSKASDRVQSKRTIETPGFLISLILIARFAFWGYLFTIRDFPRSKVATGLLVFGKNIFVSMYVNTTLYKIREF